MRLYRYPGGDGIPSISPPCLRIELALGKIGEPFEAVDLKTPAQVRAVNRDGRLPALEIDGVIFTDSTLIMDELERRFPGKFPCPADPHACTTDRLWEHFVNDHLYWVGYYLRWIVEGNRTRMLQRLFGRAPFLLRKLGPRALTRSARRRMAWYGFAEKSEEEMWARLDRGLAMLELGLEGGPFLAGRDTPGRGDLACASHLCQGGFAGTMPDSEARLAARPALIAHTARVFAACGFEPPRWIAEHAPPG